ncbi:MAG: lysylphosphatidylglycerol synthase transmembrane domain-containing protein [Raineya sp.]|nr:lysylphosphatidylglycerol synthase transmembrane domain-containing protein [Raineya sp.]
MKKFLSYILPLGIGIALFYFLIVPNLDFNELAKTFTEANPWWLVLSSVFALISHWARGARSCMLLAPLGYKVRAYPAFLAVMVGYLTNLALPRAGEVARCGVLQKMEGVPAQITFGTVVTERIIDVFILFGLVLAVLALEFERISNILTGALTNLFQQVSVEKMYWLGAVGLVFVLLIGILMYVFRKKLRMFLQSRLGSFLKGIWQGILSFRNVQNKPLFIFYTILIWVMYYLMSYVLFFIRPETATLTPLQALAILVMGGIGMALPVQGGIGAYNLLVGKTLESYQIAPNPQQNIDLSFTIGTFMHIVQTLVVLIFGGLAFILVWFVSKKDTKIKEGEAGIANTP